MDYKAYYENEKQKLLKKDDFNETEKGELINYLQISNDLMEQSIADENFDDWIYPQLESEKVKEYMAEISDFTISFHMDGQEIIDLNNEIINYFKGNQ